MKKSKHIYSYYNQVVSITTKELIGKLDLTISVNEKVELRYI